MTRIHERIETSLPVDEAFDFIADFANTAVWDPGTVSSRRRDDGPAGVGATYDLDVRMGGRVVADAVLHPGLRAPVPGRARRPRRQRRRRGRHPVRARRRSDGRRLHAPTSAWAGCLRLVEPFLGGTFRKIGRDAAAGMTTTLEVLAAHMQAGASR